jgi:hypothetical protein
MARNSLFIVLVAFCAGATGGIAATLLLSGGDRAPDSVDSAPAAPSQGAEVAETVASLKKRMDELELKSSSNAMRATRLEKDVESIAELPRQQGVHFPTEEEWTKAAQGSLGIAGKDGKVFRAPVVRIGGIGKAGELMGMNEDDLWAKLREELHLDSYQETELKQIRKDMKAEMRELFKVDEGHTPKFDKKKFDEIRKRGDERVKNLLSADQYKKFKDEGYSSALGMGGNSFAISITSTSIETKDK